jgi:hypothetical protein
MPAKDYDFAFTSYCQNCDDRRDAFGARLRGRGIRAIREFILNRSFEREDRGVAGLGEDSRCRECREREECNNAVCVESIITES